MSPITAFSRWFDALRLSVPDAEDASRVGKVRPKEQPVQPVVRLDRWLSDGFEAYDRGVRASQFVTGAAPAELPSSAQTFKASRFVDGFEPARRAPEALSVPEPAAQPSGLLTENDPSLPAPDFVASLADLGELSFTG